MSKKFYQNSQKNMIKVFQRIVGIEDGDCSTAVLASLFEIPYEEVPQFRKLKLQGIDEFRFMRSKGYDPCCWNYTKFKNGKIKKQSLKQFLKGMKIDGGVNGLFYASVESKNYEGSSHAVIVDVNCNLVHDPSPNPCELPTHSKADGLGFGLHR